MPPWSALVKVTAPTETNNAAFSPLDFYAADLSSSARWHFEKARSITQCAREAGDGRSDTALQLLLHPPQ